MLKRVITSLNILVLVLAFSIAIVACNQAVQTAALLTPTANPTAVPSATATSRPTHTAAPAAMMVSKPTQSAEINLKIALPQGDPERGFRIASSSFGCYECHANDEFPDSGPRFASSGDLPFILERGEARLALPEYEGEATTNMEYMIESIFLPEAYMVSGEWPNEMSTVYRLIMSDQDLADILAWIATLEE
jgi:hypothetical protein